MSTQVLEKAKNVTKSEPCRHCGKPDWCYRIGELEVCHRQSPPATGWRETRKADKEGNFFYAPAIKQQSIHPQKTVRRCGFVGENSLLATKEKTIHRKQTVRPCSSVSENTHLAPEQKTIHPKQTVRPCSSVSKNAHPAPKEKQIRPKQTRYWEYPARDGSKLVRVCRVDDGEGKKKIWQERWDGFAWVKGLGAIPKDMIPIYRYAEVREAIRQGKTIFVVEGEICVDILWILGIAATCNIGGAGKWLECHSDDLEGVDVVVLCPDLDKPGVQHMQKVDLTLPIWGGQWLCAFPDSPAWENLPKSGGLDIADWIADYNLTAEDIMQAVIEDADAFRAKLEKQFPVVLEGEETTGKKPKKAQIPPPNITADAIAELYRDKLAWESEHQLWRHYGAKHDGCWSEETTESVRGLVHAYLRSHPEQPAFNSGYVSSVVTILQSDLEVKEWNEQQGLIPLRDGVLDQTTLELQPHSPGFRFTWQLPFSWADRGVGCEPIEEFLLKITGSQEIAEVLLCFLSAIVTRRADLQRYLELIGGGGTGKSTYMALAKALAGEENAVSSQLKLLESNQFETAKFYRKLLVLFPDSDRWMGGGSVLKQLTGQDPMRYERKGIQQCKDYVYQGMVILSANEPPESSDRTSGQERRKLTIGLDNRIPEYEGRNLAEEFRPYLPGLLKRVLEIPRQRVTDLIKYSDRNVPALAQKKWAQLIETNPIAAWVDDCLIISPDTKGYIGKDDPEQAGRWLYANFCKYQRESGHRSVLPVKRFSANLRDLLKNQMKVAVQEGRDRNGAYIQGVGLRCFYDPHGTEFQRPITKGDCDNISENCDGFEEKCDGFVTDESLTSVGCDGCDGFLGNSKISEKNQEIAASEKITNQGCAGESEENPSHPSHPAPASVPTITNPSQQEPNPSPALQLAALLRLADCWAQVEEAIATNPESKTEAWSQLTPEEQNRIRGLKPRAVTYSQGDKVAKKANPEQVGVVERFDANFGEYQVHFDCSTEWLNPADLIPVEVKA